MADETCVVHSDPEILGGTPVFVGTRVAVQSLFDYIEAGDTIDEFLSFRPARTGHCRARARARDPGDSCAYRLTKTSARPERRSRRPLRINGSRPGLGALPFAVVVVGAPSNRMEDLAPLVPEILEVLREVHPDTVEYVGRAGKRPDRLKKP